MILAHARARYANLLKQIKGSLFLGVPHRGSDNAFWGAFAASLLQKAQLGMGTKTAFLNDLKRNSPHFAQISQEFVERGANLQIRTFYGKPIPVPALCQIRVASLKVFYCGF